MIKTLTRYSGDISGVYCLSHFQIEVCDWLSHPSAEAVRQKYYTVPNSSLLILTDLTNNNRDFLFGDG